MKERLCVTFAALVLAAVFAVAQTGGSIQVEIAYTGSGTVNASHKIYVALWDSADFSGGPPVAVKSLDSKSGTVTFTDVQKGPAYVSTAYDPTGEWDAQSPPPSGSSVGMYSTNPPTPNSIEVKQGKITNVRIAFDDSNKVP